MKPEFIQSTQLSAVDSVVHGFFGRRGGISKGIFASLNGGLQVGDEPASVRANRNRMLLALSVPDCRMLTLRQVHSARVQIITATVPADTIEADALVTSQRGLMLGIATADCAPVLFSAPDGGVIAAAHAGWRGALAGVLPNTLDAMCRLGVQDTARVTATIGPMIQQPSFQVGANVRAAFIVQQANWQQFFVPSRKTGCFLFDLSGLLRSQLEALQVRVEQITVDTCRSPDNYFSHRYATHQQLPATGRQLSLIGNRTLDNEVFTTWQ